MFSALKKKSGTHKFQYDRQVGTAVKSRLMQNVARFCEQGIEEIISRYDKRLRFGSNYLQNWWESSVINP
jgi:hypothetical protein